MIKSKVKIKNESIEKLDLMIVNKCPLKNICKDNNLIKKINARKIIEYSSNYFRTFEQNESKLFHFAQMNMY